MLTIKNKSYKQAAKEEIRKYIMGFMKKYLEYYFINSKTQ